jgi:phosphotransferase system enzyme I (PtsP)
MTSKAAPARESTDRTPVGSREKLSELRLIVETVSRASDLDSALLAIVKGVSGVLAADLCSIYLTDHTHNCHVLMVSHGLDVAAVGHVKLGLNEGLVGFIAERSEPLNLANAQALAHYRAEPNIGEESFPGFLGVPIIHQAETQGVLIVQCRASRRFNESSVAFLLTLAAQLATRIALARVRTQLILHDEISTGLPEVDSIVGLSSVAGIAAGTGVVIYSPMDISRVPDNQALSVDIEIQAFRAAVDVVVDDY